MAKSTQKDAKTEARAGSPATKSKRPARKAASKRPATKKAATARVVARRPARKPISERTFSESERRHMIAEAAYYLAEKRGFADGDPTRDWIAAEAQIDAQLRQRRLG
jgi:hypothetical protein